MLVLVLLPLVGVSLANSIYWADRGQRACGEFDDQGEFIRIVPKQKCAESKVYFVKRGDRASTAPLPHIQDSCAPGNPKTLSAEAREAIAAVNHIAGLNFRTSLKDPEISKYYEKQCAQALQKALKKGPIFSPFLFEHSEPIEDFSFADLRGSSPNRFFHYTSYSDLAQNFLPAEEDRGLAHSQLRGHGYREVFESTRTGVWNSGYGVAYFAQALFVAADSDSTSGYGYHQIALDLDPKARVLSWLTYDDWQEFTGEIQENYPTLKVCNYNDLYSDLAAEILPIAMEGTGIALYDYGDDHQWFVFTSHGAILGSDVRYDYRY